MTRLASGGGFFEGPRWREGRWWVSDFYRRQVLTYSDNGHEEVIAEVESQPSGLGWLPDGSMVVASMKDHRLLRLDGSDLIEVADLSSLCGGYLNDLVVDDHGHVFVGDFGFDLMAGGPAAPTSLKRVDLDGTVTVVADGLNFPNGAVITPDGETLIVGETLGNRYSAFDLEPDGTLTNRRVWAEFAAAPDGESAEEVLAQIVVAPDGCTLDAEGHIWAADALGSRAIRVAPSGAIVDQIDAPQGMGIFACALGGEDGMSLLLCCAPDFFEHNRAPVREAELHVALVDVPHAGRP